jgi:hypothetical protein
MSQRITSTRDQELRQDRLEKFARGRPIRLRALVAISNRDKLAW